MMNDIDELNALLGVMILEVYPDRAKEIIKSLRIIRSNVYPILEELNLGMTEEDVLDCISSSLCFLAKNATIKEIEWKNLIMTKHSIIKSNLK